MHGLSFRQSAMILGSMTSIVSALVLPERSSMINPSKQLMQSIPFMSLKSQSGRPLFAESGKTFDPENPSSETSRMDGFDLNVALFCGGLAFDAYQEPPANSTRWEKGSKGMNVAFLSQAFTRSLYKGLVEVTPLKCAGLPEEDDQMEALISGGGVDASIMVAAVEGQWEEDIALLKQEYHEGILDLTGAAHIGKSTTAWSNVDERKSNAEKKKTGKAPPYHIKKSWGKDAAAIWPERDPFYLYVQDPANVQMLFTLFDDDVIGDGSAIGSTYIPLSKVLPQVKYSQDEIVSKLKQEIVEKIQRGEMDVENIEDEISKAIDQDTQAWEGRLKMTSKPRIKNKNSQIAAGAAAGAFLAGPVGAAVGAGVASMYEGQVKGSMELRLRYLPIPQIPGKRNRYVVTGGMPGIFWGTLYEKHLSEALGYDDEADETSSAVQMERFGGKDLEHCFFINHQETGGCCAVYRSLEKKLIVISFRGTCAPIDLVTDASIVQEPWVEGEDAKEPGIAKVHVGFRKSLNSISRRLKELVLAAVGRDDQISDYDILVTGHSLGGALATLFTADIAEYGLDAGRALPSTDESDAWWKAITNTFMGSSGKKEASREPPRPKSLRVYNFGSPRVGNKEFSKRFNGLIENGNIDQAYRIVNGKDVVARMPRTMAPLAVDYDHCGSTVLVEAPTQENPGKVLWIEGESDDNACPVRDFEQMTASPLSEGTLLGDLMKAMKGDGDNIDDGKTKKLLDNVGDIASKFQERLSTVTASDITSLVGIDKSFTDREVQMVQALLRGEALAHHMEDSYYAAMGSASGFVAIVGEDLVPVNDSTINLLMSEAEQDDLKTKLEDMNPEDFEKKFTSLVAGGAKS